MGTANISITLIIVFLVVGIVIPFAQDAFQDTSTTQGQDKITSDISELTETENTLSLGKVILSVLKMFLWTFGDLPFWLDGFFVILRIVMYWTGALALRGVG